VLVLANFDTLAGGTGVTAVILVLTVPVAFAVGFAGYGVVRSRLSSTAAADLS
jgi:hypothetical protein